MSASGFGIQSESVTVMWIRIDSATPFLSLYNEINFLFRNFLGNLTKGSLFHRYFFVINKWKLKNFFTFNLFVKKFYRKHVPNNLILWVFWNQWFEYKLKLGKFKMVAPIFRIKVNENSLFFMKVDIDKGPSGHKIQVRSQIWKIQNDRSNMIRLDNFGFFNFWSIISDPLFWALKGRKILTFLYINFYSRTLSICISYGHIFLK